MTTTINDRIASIVTAFEGAETAPAVVVKRRGFFYAQCGRWESEKGTRSESEALDALEELVTNAAKQRACGVGRYTLDCAVQETARNRSNVAYWRAKFESAERELAAAEAKESAAAEDYRARLAQSDDTVRRLHAVLYP